MTRINVDETIMGKRCENERNESGLWGGEGGIREEREEREEKRRADQMKNKEK